MVLTLSNPLLPTDADIPGVGGLLAFAGLPDEPGGGVTFSLTSGNDLEISGAVTIPAISGDTVSITLPGNVAQVVSVQVGGAIYTRAPGNTPDPGEYTYRPQSQTLTVAPLDGVEEGDTGLVVGIRDRVGTPLIPLEWDEPLDPLWLKWNVSGDVSVSRGLREHPACSFGFKNWAANQDEILADWVNGQTTWLLRGVRFRQTSITIDYLNDDARLAVQVTIEGEGIHRKPLDEPIEFVIPEESPTRSSSVALLCAESGVAYVGPEIKVPVPDDLSALDRTTAGEWIGDRDRSVAGYAYYSNPDAVEVRPWKSPTVQMLSDLELTDGYPSLSIQGDGASFDGVPLAVEYDNRPWEPDTSESADKANRDVIEVLYSASSTNVDEPPDGVDLRDEGLSWPSGPTEWEKWETRINGQLVSVKYREYALLFRAVWVYEYRSATKSDVYLNLPPGSFWRICKEYTTKVSYLRQEEGGWLVQEKDTGWEWASYSRDDTLNLRRQYEEAAPGERKSTLLKKLYLSCYQKPLGSGSQVGSVPRFPDLKQPINRVRRYTLANLSDYYQDVEQPAEGDPQPKFVLVSSDTDSCRLTAPNPDATSTKPLPDLVIGKNFSNVERVRILSPKPGVPPQNESEKYEGRTETRGEEGPGFTDKAKVTSIEQRSGRPGTAQRLKLYEYGASPQSAVETAVDLINGKTYLFNTPGNGFGPDDPRGDSISFPGVVDPAQAQLNAECECSEQNARAYQTSVRYTPNRRLEEGSIVFVLNQPYRVLGVDESFSIIGPGDTAGTCKAQAAEGFQASIGRNFDIPLTVYEVEA